MQPNEAGLAERQENVIRRLRRDIARIMAASLEFFDEHRPDELNRRAPLTGAETADVVQTIQQIRAALQKSWRGFTDIYALQPSRMTERKTELVNLIIMHSQLLLGHDDEAAAEKGIPKQGIMVNLRGDTVTAWVQGRIPDGELARLIARRRRAGRPMPQSEIDLELKSLWDQGRRPDVNVWVGRWTRTIATCLHRILAACFEFTSEVRIRYLHLDDDQSRAVYGEFGEAQEEAIMAAVQGEAQRLADNTGLYVQIIDKAGNIVGEKAPSQEIEKYVHQLAVRRGKASRGDWSRRKQLAAYAKNPDAEGLDRAMLALWTQVL